MKTSEQQARDRQRTPCTGEFLKEAEDDAAEQEFLDDRVPAIIPRMVTAPPTDTPPLVLYPPNRTINANVATKSPRPTEMPMRRPGLATVVSSSATGRCSRTRTAAA